MENVIWLHRKGKNTWMFEWDSGYVGYCFYTPDNVYRIDFAMKADSPYFIVKMKGNYAYEDVTRKLRSNYLEFVSGDCYYFNNY